MEPLIHHSTSVEETRIFAQQWIGQVPLPEGRALAIALVGSLGAGKTAFTRGLVAGLKATTEVRVTSPTFGLLHAYSTEPPCYHLDLYRLKLEDDEFLESLEELLQKPGSIICIEWPERCMQFLSSRVCYWVALQHQADQEADQGFSDSGCRLIRITGQPPSLIDKT